jgi:hypothetical protein
VTLHGGTPGDTTSLLATTLTAAEQLATVQATAPTALVGDLGYTTSSTLPLLFTMTDGNNSRARPKCPRSEPCRKSVSVLTPGSLCVKRGTYYGSLINTIAFPIAV